MKPPVVLSSEHAGNRVPHRYRELFADSEEVLASHRGWDEGAGPLARDFSRSLDLPLFECTTTRLLVDLNRSRHHRRLFSEFTRPLPEAEREAILAEWWTPHRSGVRAAVEDAAARGRPVVHLSVHSFTPTWEGVERGVDLGFLYDPGRPHERRLAGAWIAALAAERPDLRLRRNRPYRGTADGLTQTLRVELGAAAYAGLELEVSQAFPRGPAAEWRALRRLLTRTFPLALDAMSADS